MRTGWLGVLVAIWGCDGSGWPLPSGSSSAADADAAGDTAPDSVTGNDAAPPPPPSVAVAIDPNSCVGRCTFFAAEAACQCDDTCVAYGDCCADRTTLCGALPPPVLVDSCAGRCGLATSGAACQCDPQCEEAGDCCEDREQYCIPQGGFSVPVCDAGFSADLAGECQPVSCAPPTVLPGTVWKVVGLELLSPGSGYLANKSKSQLGKLVNLLPDINEGLEAYLQDLHLALVHNPCGNDGLCALDWLPYPSDTAGAAADSSALTVAAAGWLGSSDAETCPARIRVRPDDGPALPSDLLWLPLSIPLANGAVMQLPFRDIQWSPLTTVPRKLRLRTALAADDLQVMLDGLPEDAVAPIGGKQMLRRIQTGLLAPDLDLNGDGTNESISAAWTVTLEPIAVSDVTLLPFPSTSTAANPEEP